ncbi:MAG: hypothetical protein H0U88_08555 [Chthoniobacterales bacterium]|nr:hypothetical protein [Chthoniobacterales bacterium]
MNDFSELEAELKAMRPAAPSATLLARVERELAERATATQTAGVLPRRRESRVNWFGLGLGLAAAAAFLLLARMKVDQPVQTHPPVIAAASAAPQSMDVVPRTLVPDGVTRVVYNTSDEGLVYPESSAEPVRRVRSRSRETLQWKDPGTGASLRVSYPTEEVEFIPISGQ